ncbi:MAG: hypothetical protein QMC85_05755 [Methanocellales archaeon]|nr:hypothetical protein [Methanocellales archaeon]MDI6859980.1 hypothetical protein [Methanocellales archaeon]MDI6902863.1 hypothetical protein [Methanocellales archaeon]
MITHGAEFKVAEIITLVILIPSFYYMLTVCRQDKRWCIFTYAVGFLLLSTIFAVLREFHSFMIFRRLEWLCILLAGIIFAYACYSSNRRLTEIRG